jgi:hypothetical protein
MNLSENIMVLLKDVHVLMDSMMPVKLSVKDVLLNVKLVKIMLTGVLYVNSVETLFLFVDVQLIYSKPLMIKMN